MKYKSGPLQGIKYWKYHNPKNVDNQEISYFHIPEDLSGNFQDILITRVTTRYHKTLDNIAPKSRGIGISNIGGDFFIKTYFRPHQIYYTINPCTQEEYLQAIEEFNNCI